MFGIGPATRIYLAAGGTDMRKNFEGLYGLVRDRLAFSILRFEMSENGRKCPGFDKCVRGANDQAIDTGSFPRCRGYVPTR
jgi:hypothetical protein